MSLVEQVLASCREADKYHSKRTLYTVGAAMSAEMGEVSEEIQIAMGDSYKTPGADGVNGEAVDPHYCWLGLAVRQQSRHYRRTTHGTCRT